MNLTALAAPILAALMVDPTHSKRSLPELARYALDAAAELVRQQQARVAEESQKDL